MLSQSIQLDITEDELLLIKISLRDRKNSCERHVTINQELKSIPIHQGKPEIDESIQFWQEKVTEAENLLDRL